MARLNERNDWFDLWFEDKQAMMGTMALMIGTGMLARGIDYRSSVPKVRKKFCSEFDEF